MGASGKQETVGDVFRRYDADGSGGLDVKELRSALFSLGLPLNTPTAASMLAQLEASGEAVPHLHFKFWHAVLMWPIIPPIISGILCRNLFQIFCNLAFLFVGRKAGQINILASPCAK